MKKYREYCRNYDLNPNDFSDPAVEILIKLSEQVGMFHVFQEKIQKEILKISRVYCKEILEKFMVLGNLNKEEAISLLLCDESIPNFDELVIKTAKELSETLVFD